jgi:2-polyprenyl-6-methoxyphenol hydroxylase-like FAD-dependent oxidoreductase
MPTTSSPDVECVSLLLDRGVRCLGTDGPSMGAAHGGAPVHVAGLGGGMVFAESLANLAAVPDGAFFRFLPLKIARSSGGPGQRGRGRAPAADIVAATDDTLMVTNALHLRPGTRWRGRRTVLIGDAAHAASPATGQGASMALEDAVVLAKALRDADSPAAALARYERHRRPRVEHNMAVSAQLTANSTAGPAPSADGNQAQPPREHRRPPSQVDEDLIRLLDWRTPLPDA